MVTPQEKAQCASWFIEIKSDVLTQRRYKTKYGKNPPSRSSIRRWHKKFMETGSVLDAVRTGRLRISAENIESVRQAFSRSPMKSIRTAARQLELPPTTVHKVLHKRLRLILNQLSYFSKMVHHCIGDYVFVSSSMKHFQTDGLEEMDRFHGHLVHQTLFPWTSFYGVV